VSVVAKLLCVSLFERTVDHPIDGIDGGLMVVALMFAFIPLIPVVMPVIPVVMPVILVLRVASLASIA
jgi:hypothetical protein